MNTRTVTKLNQLIRAWPKGTIASQKWLATLGIDRFLAEYYCRSGWLERIGHGAYKLFNDNITWSGAIYTLQFQLDYQLHVAAQTALALHGYRQYIQLSDESPIWIFKDNKEKRKLPKWFIANFSAKQPIYCIARNLFSCKATMGIDQTKIDHYDIKVSIPERAILEYLDLVPKYFSVEQAKFLIESMVTLRPESLQIFLEYCHSIRTKRLFMLLAEHEQHHWWEKLNSRKINLGSGKLKVGKGGNYYPKYKLSLPIKLEGHEGYDSAK